jgi:hypothetical protein
MSSFEQWENIKFCQKLSKSASETLQMIKQTYGKEALSSSAVFKWHKRFAQGRDSSEYHEHTGWPRMVITVFKIQEAVMLVCANRSQMVDEIEAAAGSRSHGNHPRRSDCKQAPLQGDPPDYAIQFIVSVLNFGAGRTSCCYMTTPLHITLCLSKRSWQNKRSPFCHTLHTHLIPHHAIIFLSPLERKSYIGVNFS